MNITISRCRFGNGQEGFRLDCSQFQVEMNTTCFAVLAASVAGAGVCLVGVSACATLYLVEHAADLQGIFAAVAAHNAAGASASSDVVIVPASGPIAASILTSLAGGTAAALGAGAGSAMLGRSMVAAKACVVAKGSVAAGAVSLSQGLLCFTVAGLGFLVVGGTIMYVAGRFDRGAQQELSVDSPEMAGGGNGGAPLAAAGPLEGIRIRQGFDAGRAVDF